MNLLAFVVAVILAAQTPPSEVDKLKSELDQLKARNAELQKQLEAAKEPKAEWAKLQADLKAKMAAAAEQQARKEQTAVVPPVLVAPAIGEWKVTAVANEIGLVVISLGSDDGVREGQVYTIVRGADTIGTMRIDRVDAKWSAGKVVNKSGDPKVGDTIRAAASKPVYHTFTPAVTAPGSVDELRALRKELDEVRGQVQSLTDRLLPSWKEVGVTVEEASEPLCSQLQIGRGLLVRQVREGSPAAKILKANDVIADRTEAQLMEVFRSGGTLPLRRQGKLQVFQVDPIR